MLDSSIDGSGAFFQLRRFRIVYDARELSAVCRQTFRETFEATNTPEDLEKFLGDTYDETILAQEIVNPESEVYLVQSESGKTLGYLKINRGSAQTESGYDNSLEIQRIYIVKEAKGFKFFSSHSFIVGDDHQKDLLMKKQI